VRTQLEHLPNYLGLPKLTRRVLLSDARAPFDKVMLCGPDGALDFKNSLRERSVGRRQRRMQWLRNGNLIAPDWRAVRPQVDSAA
jgi:hypothetical protein